MLNTTRTRIKDEQSDTFFLTEMYRPGPLPWTGIHTSSDKTAKVGTTSTMLDVNNRGFRKAQSRGEVVLGDMWLERVSRIMFPGSLTLGPYDHVTAVGPIGSWNRMSGEYACYVEPLVRIVSPLSAYGAQMQQMALAKAYAKVNSAAICGGEVLKDLDQTIGMLRRPFGSTYDILKRMLKHKQRRIGKTAISELKAAKNAWLEYRYGLQPTMLDFDSIVDDIHKKRNIVESRRLVVRAGEHATFNKTQAFVDKIGSPGWRSTGSNSISHDVVASAGVIYDIKNRTASSKVAQVLGFRPKDAPVTLWNMLPYSFVVDWAFNVGNWLQAITPDPDVVIRGSWFTTVDHKVEILCPGTNSYTQEGLPTAYGTYGESCVTTDIVTRTTNPIISSTPVLTFKPLSGLHSVDALALMHGSISRALSRLVH